MHASEQTDKFHTEMLKYTKLINKTSLEYIQYIASLEGIQYNVRYRIRHTR